VLEMSGRRITNVRVEPENAQKENTRMLEDAVKPRAAGAQYQDRDVDRDVSAADPRSKN
jgi:hypothetical protein